MANDFSGDANCVALWRYESGALDVDSIGGNDLTASGIFPTANTTDYKEGAGSADFEKGSFQYLRRNDVNLDAGFPLKSGDANKKISVCSWFQMESTGTQMGLFTKYDGAQNKRSLQGMTCP